MRHRQCEFIYSTQRAPNVRTFISGRLTGGRGTQHIFHPCSESAKHRPYSAEQSLDRRCRDSPSTAAKNTPYQSDLHAERLQIDSSSNFDRPLAIRCLILEGNMHVAANEGPRRIWISKRERLRDATGGERYFSLGVVAKNTRAWPAWPACLTHGTLVQSPMFNTPSFRCHYNCLTEGDLFLKNEILAGTTCQYEEF